jgi:hypothetical protein
MIAAATRGVQKFDPAGNRTIFEWTAKFVHPRDTTRTRLSSLDQTASPRAAARSRADRADDHARTRRPDSSVRPEFWHPTRSCVPNLRRYLPILLIAFLLLFILSTLLKKKSSAGASPGTRAAQTIDGMNLIDKGEQRYLAAHGCFTRHLADLLSTCLAGCKHGGRSSRRVSTA